MRLHPVYAIWFGSSTPAGYAQSFALRPNFDVPFPGQAIFPASTPGLTVGSRRAVQIDIDGTAIGIRYPYEVNLVSDAASALQVLRPLLGRKEDRSSRQTVEGHVASW